MISKKLNTIQEMYDSARNDIQSIQYTPFQFLVVSKKGQGIDYDNIKLSDGRQNIDAIVNNTDHFSQNHDSFINDKIIIQLKQWMIDEAMVVYIENFEYIGNLDLENDLVEFDPFEDQHQTQSRQLDEQQTLKKQNKEMKNQQKQDVVIQEQLQQQEVEDSEEEVKDDLFIHQTQIKGRVLKKYEKKFSQFGIIIQPLTEKYSKNIEVYFFNSPQYNYFAINKTYLIFRIVCKYFNNAVQFNGNEKAYVQEIPETIPLRLKYKTISQILQGSKHQLFDLIAVITQKQSHNDQKDSYIVCDQSGEINLTIWKNQPAPITQTFQCYDIIVMKSVKFDINNKNNRKYLNFVTVSYHVQSQEYEETNVYEKIMKLKEWTLQKQFEKLSLSKQLYTLAQVKQMIQETGNQQNINSFQACCFISAIDHSKLTYFRCPTCSQSMKLKQGIYICKKMHVQSVAPKRNFHLFLDIISDNVQEKAIIFDELAKNIIGMDADAFSQLSFQGQKDLLNRIIYKLYEIESNDYRSQQIQITKMKLLEQEQVPQQEDLQFNEFL